MVVYMKPSFANTQSFSFMNSAISELLNLSHDLGSPERDLAILGEGNTSTSLSEDRFLVKASGSSLGPFNDLVECKAEPMHNLLQRESATDQEIDDALYACRVDRITNRLDEHHRQKALGL
jgi:rhamnose utilization protein RhaD (predicted bifunctional aldolase and dehydrogenase)